ncbi:MAG: hydrogenase maturation protease [Candidatus Omnitrophica bacterium]|nr:hydrogenase maturation protease [Candidatus Omnitrophota bacterium]
MTPVLIMGIGNECRGDDGVGIVVAQAMEARRLQNVVVRKERRDGLSLMELWKPFSYVVAIDAVSLSEGAQPGRIHRFEVHRVPVPSRFSSCSTHAFGLAEAVELARTLKQLPRQFIVYGIEGIDFSEKRGLCSEVSKALPEVESQILHDFESWQAVGEGALR